MQLVALLADIEPIAPVWVKIGLSVMGLLCCGMFYLGRYLGHIARSLDTLNDQLSKVFERQEEQDTALKDHDTRIVALETRVQKQ